MRPNELRALVKECILEVLRENLTEALDPLSQGPNIPEENPYPAWNSYMRKLEEEGDHGRYAQEAGAGQFDARTFQEIRDREDPKGLNHDLRLECVKCGNTQTCRCSKPKRHFKGICDSCCETVTCESCSHPFNYNSITECSMGLVKCPSCGVKVDQEGHAH